MAAACPMWHPCPVEDCPTSAVAPPVHVGAVEVTLDADDHPTAQVDVTSDLRPFMEHLRVTHRIVPRSTDG